MKDNKSGQNNNVIDITERMQEPDQKARLRNLKVRFDLEQAKVGLSASLLSIVFLVTLANNNLMKSDEVSQPTRGIASIPTGTSDAEDSFVRSLAQRELSAKSVVGQKPSEVEKLAFGVLEGKYSMRLENGKLLELSFSRNGEDPKLVSDLAQFLKIHKDLLPVDFDKSVKVSRTENNGEADETYQLVDAISRPVANVQFHLDQEGRLLAMKVSHRQVAAN